MATTGPVGGRPLQVKQCIRLVTLAAERRSETARHDGRQYMTLEGFPSAGYVGEVGVRLGFRAARRNGRGEHSQGVRAPTLSPV